MWRNVVAQGLEEGEGRESVVDPAGRGTPGLHGTHGLTTANNCYQLEMNVHTLLMIIYVKAISKICIGNRYAITE